MPRAVDVSTEVGTIVSEKLALDNKFFTVIERVVQNPDGTIREPQLLWDRGGKCFAIAVGQDEEGKIVLVEEPKYGQMRRMVSVPTGGAKKGESPLDAAKREFFEETGYECEEWVPVEAEPLVDFADKTDGGEHYVFMGINARKVADPREPKQKVILADQSEALTLMRKGRMPAMSIAAFLLAMGQYNGWNLQVPV